MNDKTLEKLLQTDTGKALVGLIVAAGSERLLIERLEIEPNDLHNWKQRGQISTGHSIAVQNNAYFAGLGWTKEKCRPDMTQSDWKRIGLA